MNDENLDKDENLEDRIEDILRDVKEEEGLTKDSIAMIICLENEIDMLETQIDLADSTIRLIKEGTIFATYDGDRDKSYDLDHFVVAQKENKKDDK